MGAVNAATHAQEQTIWEIYEPTLVYGLGADTIRLILTRLRISGMRVHHCAGRAEPAPLPARVEGQGGP